MLVVFWRWFFREFWEISFANEIPKNVHSFKMFQNNADSELGWYLAGNYCAVGAVAGFLYSAEEYYKVYSESLNIL